MKKTMIALKIFFPAIAAALFLAFAAPRPAPAADMNKPLRIILPITKGLEGGSFSKLMTDVIKVLEQETGYKFQLIEKVYRMGDDDTKLVLDAFKSGQGELGYVSSVELVEKEQQLSKIMKPAFTMVFNGSKHSEECLYVRENSGINSIQDMRGKTWGGSRVYFTRLIFYENGINEPLSKFFGNTVFIEDAPPSISIDKLMKGEVDVVAANKNHLAIGGAGITGTDEKTKTPVKYKIIKCVPGELNWVFVYSPAVSEEVASKLTTTFVTAHKNPKFQQFKFIFTAIKGGFAPIKDSDFDRSRQIAKYKVTLGWNDEQKEHLKKRK